MGQLDSLNPVGISTTSSTGALAGYYQSGASTTNHVSPNSVSTAVVGQDDYNQNMTERNQYRNHHQYPELYSAAQ